MERAARRVLGLGMAASLMGCSGGSGGAVSPSAGSAVSIASAKATGTAPGSKLPCPPADIAPALLRESRRIEIDGNEECWALAWEAAPRSICSEGDESWYCKLLPSGQEGDLDVIRTRAGAPAEVVRIRGALPGKETMAVLAVFGHQGEDTDAMRLLNVRDFDHDGRAAEIKLLLRPGDAVLDETRSPVAVIEIPPYYGFRSIAVGVPPGSNRLTAIGPASTPGMPLVLPGENGWNLLLGATDAELASGVELALRSCTDHTSTQTVLIHAGRGGISLEQQKRSCVCGVEGCTWHNQRILGRSPWPEHRP